MSEIEAAAERILAKRIGWGDAKEVIASQVAAHREWNSDLWREAMDTALVAIGPAFECPMSMEAIRLNVGRRLPEGAEFTVDTVVPYGRSIIVLYRRPAHPAPVGNVTMPVEHRCCVISLRHGYSTSDMIVP